jgi:hypothetical protein
MALEKAQGAFHHDALTPGASDEARRRARAPTPPAAHHHRCRRESAPTFRYRLDRDKLRQVRRRGGRYLLRTNLADDDSARLWSYYLQLGHIEEAFRDIRGDLTVRPIFHQLESRVEAHIFIAFLAYCLHVTLARRLGALAPGLTPRSVLEKFSAVQMIDVHIPTTDGREIQLTRHTEPQAELKLLLDKLKLQLPPQPAPRINLRPSHPANPFVVPAFGVPLK